MYIWDCELILFINSTNSSATIIFYLRELFYNKPTMVKKIIIYDSLRLHKDERY